MKSASSLRNAFLVALLSSIAFLPCASGAAVPEVQSDVPEGFDVRKFVCPLGAEKFTQDVGYSSLVLVQFPDGSWLGDEGIDAQIPQCPGNGLLLIPDYDSTDDSQNISYLTYTPEQLARLPALIENETFRRLRDKSRHERAQWLATQLDMSVQTRWQLLVRGSWTALDPAERRRLVTRIAEEGPSLIDALDARGFYKEQQRLLIANALRELGRFDAAQSLLASNHDAIPADANIKDPDSAQALISAIASMWDAIAHRDDDRFPVDLSTERWIGQICRGASLPPPYGPITENAKKACERRKQERQADEDAFHEAIRLREAPQELTRLCQETSEDKRSSGLARACAEAQNERDQKAGEALVLNQAPQVVADCDATPERALEGALRYACISYRTSLESQLTHLLIDDEAAYKIICDDGRDPPDRASFAYMACSGVERERTDRAVEKLLAHPESLDASCAATSGNQRNEPLTFACVKRGYDLMRVDAERFAADPKAYAAACAAIDARPEAALPSNNSADEFRCAEAKRIRERNEETARRAVLADLEHSPTQRSLIDAPPGTDIYDEGSELNRVALERAREIIARAKAEGTYPKRKPGDLY